MNERMLLHGLNGGLVLLYGLFLSVFVAGRWQDKKQRGLVIAMCPALLLIQVPFWLLLGETTVEQLYPLIIHLPLMLFLIFGLKKSAGIAVVSVLIAYLCCQLPRWVKIAAVVAFRSELVGEVAYLVFIGPLFYVLMRFFVKPTYNLIMYNRQSLMLFGSLPAVYYVFDYCTTIYSKLLYAGIPALNELLPTALIMFYTVFLTIYHRETQKRMKAELELSAQNVLLDQAQKEMDALQKLHMRNAIYRHDMRHHLNVMDGFLTAGKTDQALAYIRKAQENLTAITPKRFCGNDTMNLICSSFEEKAGEAGVRMEIRAQLPEKLAISDTELCALLSNALENALNAVAALPEGEQWIELYCGVKRNKLLIEVKNPYAGRIVMEDGLPVVSEAGHGFGCRSIRAIVLRHQGLYTFAPENGIFTLQIVLPMISG